MNKYKNRLLINILVFVSVTIVSIFIVPYIAFIPLSIGVFRIYWLVKNNKLN